MRDPTSCDLPNSTTHALHARFLWLISEFLSTHIPPRAGGLSTRSQCRSHIDEKYRPTATTAHRADEADAYSKPSQLFGASAISICYYTAPGSWGCSYILVTQQIHLRFSLRGISDPKVRCLHSEHLQIQREFIHITFPSYIALTAVVVWHCLARKLARSSSIDDHLALSEALLPELPILLPAGFAER